MVSGAFSGAGLLRGLRRQTWLRPTDASVVLMPDRVAQIDVVRTGCGPTDGTNGAADHRPADRADAGDTADNCAGTGADQAAGDGTVAWLMTATGQGQPEGRENDDVGNVRDMTNTFKSGMAGEAS
jgi:hypothetical protein